MKKLGDVFMTSFKIDSRLQFFNKALILSFTPKKYLPCFCQWSGLLNVLTWTCKSLHTISYEKPNFWPAKPQIFENHCKLASKSNWKFLGTIACFSFVWIQNGRKFSNLEPWFYKYYDYINFLKICRYYVSYTLIFFIRNWL